MFEFLHMYGNHKKMGGEGNVSSPGVDKTSVCPSRISPDMIGGMNGDVSFPEKDETWMCRSRISPDMIGGMDGDVTFP